MKLNDKCVAPFKSEVIHRPWGHFGLYADNVISTSKILYIKPQEKLSLQYHFQRAQFYLLLDDSFIIDYSIKPVPKTIIDNPNEAERIIQLEEFLKDNLVTVEANEGDEFGFHEFVVHRATYVGNRSYGRILDLAFGINDESDIFRIKDLYGRENTK